MERKLATVLFVDLVDSTGFVSAVDPEIVRRRVSEYFDRVSGCIEAHGGIVEKFAGDAVMAAFGIPLAHEDDAERAIRAAFAILDAVHELGLEARLGVEAGEVVVEDAESTFATGEAVNLAARLEQATDPGTIRLGPGARRLAAGAVEVEDAGPLTIRGREQPLWTWRALRVLDGPRRHIGAPFVGREEDLELLHNTFARAVRGRRAHLVTIYGEPGIGKSRLVTEFVEGVERATVLMGRALPYGEGVTYWALASMIKASAGITDDDPAATAFDKLRVCCESDAVADLLAVALGVLGAAEGESSTEELAWATLRWAEQLADAQPLVLVFEDVHWADERLLDLIEHLARSLHDAPVLIVSVARPDLLDSRPSWAGGNPRSTAIELSPLDERESEALADLLLASSDVPPAQRALVLEKAEGNPLFLEETARMIAEAENGVAALARIPDTVQALIAARIDRLDPAEKRLLQRASVIGRSFWLGALRRLAGDEKVESSLDALLEREFITPVERSTITGDRAFQFKHVLIRDVAYGAISKSDRADDHRRFAQWLGEKAGDELVELRAHHLDQAAALIGELEGSIPDELAQEAGAVLEDAGRRALRRESFQSSRRLFKRAVELAPTLERRYFAAHAAWRLADYAAVTEEMALVEKQAADEHNMRIRARALAAMADVMLYTTTDAGRASVLVGRALDTLEEDPDPATRFDVLGVAGLVASWLGDQAEVERYAEEALAVARAAGRKDLETVAIQALGTVAVVRLDVAQAEQLAARALELAEESESIRARAAALRLRGWIEDLRGDIDAAEETYREVLVLYADVGYRTAVGFTNSYLGRLRLRRDDARGAERYLREAVRILSGAGDRGRRCEAERLLAQALVAQGRLEEAERYALLARETVGPQDRLSVGTTTMALGIVRAAQGRDEEAESLMREALTWHQASDLRYAEIEALQTLAEFLRTRDRADEATPLEARLDELAATARAQP
jgi:class 3 adenylate cyclase/tetratricopeptide (TPR) repeat protein